MQATNSNIKQAHGGKMPKYVEYFLDKKNNKKILIDRWASEDGGRLFNKRNRAMMVEIGESENISLDHNFIWITLNQIKKILSNEGAIVSPHLRCLLSLI